MILLDIMNQQRASKAVQQSEDWKDATKRETLDSLNFELERLLDSAPPQEVPYWQKEFEGFKRLFNRFLKSKPTITWAKIEALQSESIKPYSELEPPLTETIKEKLSKLIVVKLNGGLGTSMGCKGPKSLIVVRHDLTFLDIVMQQIQHLNITYDVDIPLVLMNSFNTDEDTKRILRKYRNVKVSVYSFNQSRYPRIDKETLMPLIRSLSGTHSSPMHDLDAWYPPGHGNFYESFLASGLLDSFLADGKEYCFVSNIDNLGATVDLNILNFICEHPQNDFVMELTDKTRADVKGGTLINYDGRLRLLELAQVSKDHYDDFTSVSHFKYFNTNSMWMNMRSIKTLVETRKMDLEIIVNHKHLSNLGLNVIQLETAAGSAIKNFRGSIGIVVPRNRFLPVKKCQDLLLVMSNLYELDDGYLKFSPKRSFPTTPLVKLGSCFDKVSDFLQRFPGIPDMLECDHLTVSGDVWFGKHVVLKGTVIIIANHGERIDIPPGSLLVNKIVSGNLRILDH